MTKRGAMAGAGFFAQFHADAWNRTEGAAISAIADVDRAKAEAFAAKWGIPRVYTDAAEMLDAERPDFLDIVTGPDTHLALAGLAAERGIHVISQKPLTPDLESSEAMVVLCRRRGVRLLVHENWRWQPWYRETRRILDSGELGRIFHIGFRMRNGDGRGDNPYTVQPYFRNMRRFLIFETLVHFLDTFRYLMGPLRSLYCQTARVSPLIAGEDYALIQLAFEDGAHGLIDANRVSGPMPLDATFGTMRIEGDRGWLRMAPDGRLFVNRHGEAEREHEYAIPATGYRGDSIRALHRHFVDCLESGAVCESEGEGYLKTVRAVFAAYESAESGRPISLLP